jgi:hypothetical protein
MEKQSVVVKREEYPVGVWDKCDNFQDEISNSPASLFMPPPPPPPSPPENIAEMSLKSEERYNNLINYACYSDVMNDIERKEIMTEDWEKLSGKEKWNKYCEYLSKKIKKEIKDEESEITKKFSQNSEEKNKWLEIMLENKNEFKIPDGYLLMNEIFNLKQEIESLKYERKNTLQVLSNTRALYSELNKNYLLLLKNK